MLRNFSSRFTTVVRITCVSFFCVLASAWVIGFLAPQPVFAQNQNQTGGFQGAVNQANQTAQAAGINQSGDLLQIIGRIINIVLGFLGVILLILFLYAGFLWMTAGDDATKVQQAKNIMRNAVIGLVIIVSAFAISSYILKLIANNIGAGGTTQNGSTLPGGGFSTSAGSLGSGIIESHYPQRNATNVARNIAIIVRFKKPIQLRSVIQDYNDNGTPENLADDTATEGLNDTSVRIFRTASGPDGRLTSAQVRVRFTADRKTFVFRPVDYLGSASENVQYTVQLLSNGVMLENGTPAFTGNFSNGYEWTFETGTTVDNTPPRVLGVFPRKGDRADRNAVIQIYFNEPLDPTAVTGLVSSGFDHLHVYAGGISPSSVVDGEYKLSSDLKTVEFIPAQPCGVNSCGEEMRCLPEGSPPIDAVAHAATIDGTGPTAQFLANGYDGVVDVAANSLDGNSDGVTQGKGSDDYAWSFGLTNTINLTPPRIELTTPPAQNASTGRENVDPFVPVSIRFDSVLQASTFNTDNATITPHEASQYADTFWWSAGVTPLTDTNMPVEKSTDVAVKTEGALLHRQFVSSTLYDPAVFSGVRNAYQNCFNPASSASCTGRPHCCLDTPSDKECTY
jgi:hypothetical protein